MRRRRAPLGTVALVIGLLKPTMTSKYSGNDPPA
jgi:hypothetical protein